MGVCMQHPVLHCDTSGTVMLRMQLSDANKADYVHAKARKLLVDGVAQQMNATANGFYSLVPRWVEQVVHTVAAACLLSTS